MKRRTDLTDKLLDKDVFRQMVKDGEIKGIKDIEDILKAM